jgi:Gpi18-like mannosyltransferase
MKTEPLRSSKSAEIFVFIEIFAIGVVFYAATYPTVAPDMTDYLIPWYRHIVHLGPVRAFAVPFSNYTPPYLYLLALGSLLHPWVSEFNVLKGISLAGACFMALAIHRLVRVADGPSPLLAAAIALVLPSTVLNASWLGQCDSYWAGACLFAVAAAIERRMIPMLLWAGVAVGFKAQAAFLAPFLIAVLLRERAGLAAWLIPPAVYAALMAPAWLAGWPFSDLLLVYPRQSVELQSAGNAANIWSTVGALAPAITHSLYPVAFVAAGGSVLVYLMAVPPRLGSARAMLIAASMSALMIPWLLPKMHERFFFLADMLTFALAMTVRSRAALLLTLAVQGASVCGYVCYSTGDLRVLAFGALLSGAALVAMPWLLKNEGGTRQTVSPESGTPKVADRKGGTGGRDVALLKANRRVRSLAR